MPSTSEILKTHFGFDTFRGPQQRIIEHVLQNRHALVIMPTGQGKSLRYQIPALAIAADDSADIEKSPITLVLSPLIALMKQQVDSLLQNGLPKDMLPATGESPICNRRKDVSKDIEEFTLSRIFQIPHGVTPFPESQRNDSAASLVTPGQDFVFCQFCEGLLSHVSVFGFE